MPIDEILGQRRLAKQKKNERDAELMRLHQLAAEALSNDFESQAVREYALSKVDKWEKKELCSLRYITEWRRILGLPPLALRQAMLRDDEEGIALRQNTPFGFLMGRLHETVMETDERQRVKNAIAEDKAWFSGRSH